MCTSVNLHHDCLTAANQQVSHLEDAQQPACKPQASAACGTVVECQRAIDLWVTGVYGLIRITGAGPGDGPPATQNLRLTCALKARFSGACSCVLSWQYLQLAADHSFIIVAGVPAATYYTQRLQAAQQEQQLLVAHT